MKYMSHKTRADIVSVLEDRAFTVLLKEDGSDIYVKNLVAECSSFDSKIYVDKEVGISRSSGDFSFLKVLVHPDVFKEEYVDPNAGIEAFPNRKHPHSNRHRSSNYHGFPDGIPGVREPYALAYKVSSLRALSILLSRLNRQ